MRKFCLYIASIIVSSVLFLSGCNTGQAKAVTTPKVVAEFEFSIKDGGILLPLTFNGEEYQFLLDTGASYTTFDLSFKNKLEGKYSQRQKDHIPGSDFIECEFYNAPDAYVGSLSLKVCPYVVLADIKDVVSQEVTNYKGVIGLDFLREYIIKIDFDNEKIIFFEGKKDFGIFSLFKSKKNKHPEWGEAINLRETFYGFRLALGNVSGNLPVEFAIDTGYSFPGTLSRRWYEFAISNLDSESEILLEYYFEDIDVLKTGRFSIGSFDYKKMLFVKSEMSTLGFPFLSHHHVTIDFPNNIMYLKKGEKYGKQFGLIRGFKGTDFMFNLNDENIYVSYVDPNGLAQTKGVKQYDIVTKIQVNEQVITSLKPIDIPVFLANLPKSEDRTYTFTFKRGEEIFTVEFSKEELNLNK